MLTGPSAILGCVRRIALRGLVCLAAGSAMAQAPASAPAASPIQGVDATQWRQGTTSLIRGWRENSGDDLAWAQPGFDDSQWKMVEIDDTGESTPGKRWFRLHVKLAPQHPHLHLLLAGGEGTYELYINGQLQHRSGLRHIFAVSRPTEQVFSLGDEETATDLVLALRTRPSRTYRFYHLPLFLTATVGTPGAVDNLRQSMESDRLYAVVPGIAINLVLVLAGIGALALFRSQRAHYEYLWLGLYLLALGISNGIADCAENGVIPLAWNDFIGDPLIYVFTIMQIQFTFSFAGERVNRIWRIYQWILPTPLILFAVMLTGRISSNPYPLVEAGLILPAALLLPARLFTWWRRGNQEAGWLILPSLLPAAAAAIFDVGFISIYEGWKHTAFLDDPIYMGPVSVGVPDLCDFLFVLAIGVVMFFRFTKVSRDQARAQAELHAAREIQRRLVPETLPEVEGYQVEAAYFPAEEVGGDFYQLLESKGGAKLVVVGDVSGKGLKAAMTGTLAMGALRALAAESLGPGTVLGRLNRQLAETGDEGFVTCICARITPQGEVTLANAGHLPPYRNGEELLLEPDLPLGIGAQEKYAEHTFRLDPGDQMTLLSDGVVEARDASGSLYGFERTRAISAQPANAIAQAALEHGQTDDITVLTVTRVRSEKKVTAAKSAVALQASGGQG